MTRENKLALVLGFGLMLFVGILVSDHLAARQSPAVAAIALGRAGDGVPPLPPPGNDERILVSGPDGTRKQLPLPDERPAGDGGTERTIVMGGPGNSDGTNSVEQNPGAGSGGGDAGAAATPELRSYQVKSGDNFGAIASREYGKKSLGPALAAFNNIAPEKLKVGASVKLPPLATLDPSAVRAQAAPPDRGTTPRETVPNPTPEIPRFKVYKVQQGDTLFGIAQRELGKGDRWKELQTSNTDVLKRGDDLMPGMQIKIPVMTASAARTTDA
ncbi:MAG: LysM peptidoglycan-binding domain-containing protein [Phycisphaerae bacterium]|nr:LysM peptidoglycan-binding domain-containing protein [Phycisphaerae bacterium]